MDPNAVVGLDTVALLGIEAVVGFGVVVQSTKINEEAVANDVPFLVE